jgi:tetratricopeptide (TPR) repeat protein
VTKLLVIGAAGVDRLSFARHVAAGALPALAALSARGVCLSLGGAAAGAGPAAWVSLATGRRPEDHGVWRADEGWAGGVRPAGRASWRAPAVWERLEAAGVATGAVAWPATRPGADWPGVHLDDELLEASGHRVEDWAVPPRAGPPAAREAVRDRRVHPEDISADMLRGFVPRLRHIDQSRDATLPVLALALARAATAQSAALWMIEAGGPAAMFLHQPWLAQVRTAFEPMPGELYADVVPAAWRFLDGLVGRLIAAAPPGARVLLVSPGFGRRPGLILGAGPGDVLDRGLRGADGLDLAPTVLGLFGLAADDLPGRSLAARGAEAARAPAPRVAVQADPGPDAALLAQAAGWGFPAPPGPSPAWRAQALAERAAATLWRDPQASARLAGQALDLDPDRLLALRVRATALVLTDQPGELPALASRLHAAAPDRGWGDLAQGAWHVLREEIAHAAPLLAKAEADLDPDTRYIVAMVWLAARRPARAERVLRGLATDDTEPARARVGLAALMIDRRDFLEAEASLAQALAENPSDASLYLQWARLCRLTARPAQARRMAALATRFGAPPGETPAIRQA